MNRAERIASVVLVAFGLCVAYYSREYLKLGQAISPGAGFLPYHVGLALAALGVAWFVATFLARRDIPATDAHADPEQLARERILLRQRILTRFLPGILLILAYAWIFERAGYFASTVLFMIGWQKGVEREGWGKTLLIALLCAGGMWAIFSFLLKGVLPSGAWFS
jgi:ABC-type Fe3+ transport system permease subunit